MSRLPLPIRDGLNPTRLAAPGHRGDAPTSAWDLVFGAIMGQRHRHPEDDESAVMKRFDQGFVVRANAKPVNPDTQLKPGQEIYFYRRPALEKTIAGPMPIVFHDRDLVVVDKPAFLATMPRGRHITETAVVRLRRELNNAELVPAHRLDRMTSGLLMFTARREVRGAYQTLFASGQVTKRYHALTTTFPIDSKAPFALSEVPSLLPGQPGLTVSSRQRKIAGELQAHTLEGEPNAHTVVEAVMLHDASSCIRHGLYLENYAQSPESSVAEWHLRPITGRTHQLRLHLRELGFPILGDQVYPEILPMEAEDPRQPLHLLCAEMSFVDPLSGEPRKFQSQRSVFSPLNLEDIAP